MRALFLAVLALTLSACASDRLSVSPPSGVDLSGHWKLNEADSDDPQHLLNPQSATHRKDQFGNPIDDPATRGSRGGGRGGRGGPGGPGGPGMGGPAGPPPPGAGMMGAPLRFPGKQVDIKQVSGVVSFSSEGRSRVCQPGTEHKKKASKPDYRDRDPSPAARDNAPPVCGWEQGTLVVMGGESDDDRPQFEEQYNLSADRQRLIETVVFKGGRSAGFVLSRVWDRVPQ